MKVNCEIINDLLPLYAEGMVSKKTSDMIVEHMTECTECKEKFDKMVKPEFQVQHNLDMAESFKKYEKKKNRKLGWKVGIATVLGVLLVPTIIVLLFLHDINDIEVYNDAENYNEYIGESADSKFRSWIDFGEDIFPENITDEMEIVDFQMVYYNPWDSQTLSHLVVKYDQETYEKEIERLKKYESKEFYGYYGVEGFHEEYDLLAIDADHYHGFIYALDAGNQEIIYVQIIFCNYFMDLDYHDYIREEYLPLGFDATLDNPYKESRKGSWVVE